MSPNKLSIPLAAAVLAVASIAVAPRADATVTLAATFDEKVEDAQAIVLGKVVRQETRFDDDQRLILTYTTFQVEKTLKGAAPGEVTVVTPGGRIGDVQQTTVGVPDFTEGQESVVFLKNTRRGPTVLYFDQGAYDVVSDRGERLVRPVATEAVHIDAQRGIAAAPEQPRSLRDFEAAVGLAEKRVRHNRMKMTMARQQQAEEAASLWSTLAENKWLIVLAALGLIVATIPFIRRS